MRSVRSFDYKDQRGEEKEFKEDGGITNSRLFRELKLLSILAFFAIVGVLARMGITVLTTYDGSYVGGVAWANFTACIAVGICIESRSTWAFIGIEKSKSLLYTGLTTGFCGTFSSFSSLMLEAFERSADITSFESYHYPNAAYGIMNCASVIITQLSLSVAGLQFGRHLIRGYDPNIKVVYLLEHTTAVLGILSWIAVICLIAIKEWRSWTFACIVSPIACFVRYYVGKWLNPKVKSFPMGTFTVNIFSTTVLAALNVANRGKLSSSPSGRIVDSELTCQMIQGLEDGFCGTLSTVATMFVELYLLKPPKSYIYGSTTLILSFCILVVFLGSYNWTQGLTNPIC